MGPKPSGVNIVKLTWNPLYLSKSGLNFLHLDNESLYDVLDLATLLSSPNKFSFIDINKSLLNVLAQKKNELRMTVHCECC